jgi:hypothetical protein
MTCDLRNIYVTVGRRAVTPVASPRLSGVTDP